MAMRFSCVGDADETRGNGLPVPMSTEQESRTTTLTEPSNRHMARTTPGGLALIIVFLASAGGSCTADMVGKESTNRPTQRPSPIASERPFVARSSDAILYGLGLSTDPYGASRPRGVGVVSLLGMNLSTRAELEQRGLRPEVWIGRTRAVAVGSSSRGPNRVILQYESGQLNIGEKLSLPTPVWDLAISPDGTEIAYEPIERTKTGYTDGNRVVLQRFDGSQRRVLTQGSLAGWTPKGNILYWQQETRQITESGTLMSIDPRTSFTSHVFSARDVTAAAYRVGLPEVGDPVHSADGQYMAALASVRWRRGNRNLSTIVILRADGSVERLITSRLAVSMFTWSPRGHRLAYTTSGFPSPHQLFVLRSPNREPVKLLSKADHFDWVTWSPDNKYLLVDDEPADRWLVIEVYTGEKHVSLPRLGGRPMWCCPTSTFATQGI